MNGLSPIQEYPDYTGVPTFLSENERGTHFSSWIKIKNTDGTIVSSNASLGLKNGT